MSGTERSKWGQRIEWALNSVSIIVLIALAGLVLKKWQGSAPDINHAAAQVLELPAVGWDDKRPTLVLALSINCSYCRASLPFYRTLDRIPQRAHLRTVALFPEVSELAAQYLVSNHIHADLVRQADLGSMGIMTPTLILTDSAGRVLKRWSGQLSKEREDAVIQELATVSVPAEPLTESASGRSIDPTELLALQNRGPAPLLIDTRDRKSYHSSHVVGSINIPMDELLARAPHEVRSDDDIVLICKQACACKKPNAEKSATMCSVGEALLRSARFRRIRALSTDTDGAKLAGVATVSSSLVALPQLVLNAERQ